MALERWLPVSRRRDSFFDRLFAGMMDDRLFFEDMDRIRQRMFHLVPWSEQDVVGTGMQVQYPIVEEDGQTKLHLKFNVKDFKPDEVKVKVVGDHTLEIHAEHQEKSDSGECHRMFKRHYTLPQGFAASGLKSELTKDGVLTIEGPAPALKSDERALTIKYTE